MGIVTEAWTVGPTDSEAGFFLLDGKVSGIAAGPCSRAATTPVGPARSTTVTCGSTGVSTTSGATA